MSARKMHAKPFEAPPRASYGKPRRTLPLGDRIPGHRRPDMTTTSRVRVGAMAAALATFAVSGCSGPGGSANTARGAGGRATAAKADGSGTLDVCALLPVATVASITGQSLTGSTSNGIGGRHAGGEGH